MCGLTIRSRASQLTAARGSLCTCCTPCSQSVYVLCGLRQETYRRFMSIKIVVTRVPRRSLTHGRGSAPVLSLYSKLSRRRESRGMRALSMPTPWDSATAWHLACLTPMANLRVVRTAATPRRAPRIGEPAASPWRTRRWEQRRRPMPESRACPATTSASMREAQAPSAAKSRAAGRPVPRSRAAAPAAPHPGRRSGIPATRSAPSKPRRAPREEQK